MGIMTKINVLSLFDGISCGQLALKRAGFKVNKYFASEIDENAMDVTFKNFPNTVQLWDVRKVRGLDLPKIDLLIGGSPCQGFSFAGKQLNFDDPRSKLFFEFVRLLKETNPKYFLLENVKMKKEYQNIITDYLGVEPILINSALVSAQNRKRLYWTNIPNIQQPKNKGIRLKSVLEFGEVDRNKAYCIDANYAKGGNLKNYFEKSRRQLVFCGRKHDGYIDIEAFRKLTPVECERLQTLPDNYTNQVNNTQRYKMLGNAWTVDVIAHIFENMKYD